MSKKLSLSRALPAFVLCFATAVLFAQQPGNIVIDKQEWRDQPVRHFYIHGVLNDDTAFQVRLPEPSAWKGRLIHYLEGSFGGYEITGESIGEHAYALAHGAIYVESSQGHRGLPIYRPKDTMKEISYEASYAAVQYAKSRCVEFYGREPDYSYVFGHSGGGFRSSGMLERFPKVYDGAVPTVGVGQWMTLALLYSIFEKYRPLVQPYAAAMSETMRPGGTGDPFAALPTPEARKALEAILKGGYPIRQLDKIDVSFVGSSVIDVLLYKVDPGYFEEFWSHAGYPGADGLLASRVVEVSGEVKASESKMAGITLNTNVAKMPPGITGYRLRFTSGALAGEWRRVVKDVGSTLILSRLGPPVDKARPGDTFIMDNRDLLAFGEYHRYIAGNEELAPLGATAATLRRPQEVLAELNEPGRPVGRFKGKMITLFSAGDADSWAAGGLRYARQVRAALGADADRRFRLHIIENAPHNFTASLPWEVNWFAEVRKALDDLTAWVEQGIEPPPATRFTLSTRNQIVLPATAAQRLGYQPVAVLSANGKHGSVEVKSGQEVVFEASAEDPDNSLSLFEMDFEGDGKVDETVELKARQEKRTFHHTFTKPGTYFATVRVTDATKSLGSTAPGIQNLAHVRVIVH